MELIKYGRFQVQKEVITDISLDEAKELFKLVDDRLVEGAWKIANPKGKKTSKKEKEDKE